MKRFYSVGVVMAVLAVLIPGRSSGEPYLAVRMGLKCVACHTNPTGGGKRTEYGTLFGQVDLPAHRIDIPDIGSDQDQDGSSEYWTGALNRFMAVGGDMRFNYNYTNIPNQDNQSEFDTEEVLLYGEVRVIPDRLSFYIDEKVAPGGADNREAYALAWFRDQTIYLKAGKLFLPYGLRIEDDTAFIRQVPGINYNTPDNGVEAGLEIDAWSASFAITNGSAGGQENDDGKQYSLLGSYVRQNWRAGGSLNYNKLNAGDRKMGNLFAGLRTGPISWLAEGDYVVDDGTPTGRRKLWAGLLEVNWLFRRGNNLKLTAEYFDPDTDVSNDNQTRYSVVWEYFPVQFVQLSAGYRHSDGIPQNDLQNIKQVFLQLHGYF